MPTRQELAHCIRILSMDAVEKARSGHPGMPMGMADIAEVLWNDFLSHNPNNPQWVNRDRFVLSNGHGSMLQYALLHLTGYDLTLDQLKNFRQLHSQTPGHPEYGDTAGVETTTGPLGQGLGHAVGMALAEQQLAREFNQPEFNLVDHFTYVLCGDGCLMEGISHEVCSLAGTMQLGKLIVLYDDNGISIDGQVAPWFNEDVPARFAAYGWQVIPAVDGHDAAQIAKALEAAKANTQQPTLICCQTVIGWGAPNKAGTHHCHGAPLGPEEMAATKQAMGWTHAAFEIPEVYQQAWDAKAAGQAREQAWQALLSAYKKEHPALAERFVARMQVTLPESWAAHVQQFIQTQQTEAKTMATRKSSLEAIASYARLLPALFGGSADLSESNCTLWPEAQALGFECEDAKKPANYVHYGVREFGMSAMMCGLALHGGFIPFGGTFLVFSDYARNALRLSALMKLRCIFVFTHDSIGLGEDGPTHQPIEHASSLRLMPRMSVWRPCDSVETAVAWKAAIENFDRPTSLLLSRQNLVVQPRDTHQVNDIERGGYVLLDNSEDGENLEAILIATGSEVELAMQAARALHAHDKVVRVVSMPCTDVFDQQSEAYRDSVLPKHVQARVAIEAGSRDFWYKYVGLAGKVIGIDRFGASAPAPQVFEAYQITAERIQQTVDALLEQTVF